MTSSKFFRCLFLLLFFITSALSFKNVSRQKRSRSSSVCPKECACQVKTNGEKTIDCIGRAFRKIPEHLPLDASYVYLSYNRIEMVSTADMQDLRSIKVLDLSHNKIKYLEKDAFNDQDRLEWLDLSNNKIENITMDIFGEGARSLKVLNISNTLMKTFPSLYDTREIYMTKVSVLSLAYNLFTDISVSSIPSSVETLDLSCLRIKSLTESFSRLAKLNKLIINGCIQSRDLSVIGRNVFDGLTVLYELHLSGNALTKIPTRLPETLVVLDLSSNKIAKIKRTPCAEELDIQNYYTFGEESNIGNDLTHLSDLKELKLNGNQIQSVCLDDFIDMNIQVLNLSSCAINSFNAEAFIYAQSLRVLDISTNYIRSFSFPELPELSELYVQENVIETVTDASPAKLTSLAVADFSFNQYRCDCNLKEFVYFLGHSTDVRIKHLTEESIFYTCSSPSSLKDEPLMSLNLDALVCEDEASKFPLWAIAAPVSLIAIILMIVIVIAVNKYKAGSCTCHCCCSCRSKDDVKKVTSHYTKYEVDSDIVIQNRVLNDVAILCHDSNHKWILNTLIPKLNRIKRNESLESDQESMDPTQPGRPLNVEVFTIGQTIRVDTLHKCIDSNRKITLVITHEFLEEKSCLYILEVIRERMENDPKEAVVAVILDAIPWKTMPAPLQRLLVDKTFLQYPQRNRERQEFYFWDNLCSLICTSEAISKRKWQDGGIDDEVMSSMMRYQKRYEEDEEQDVRDPSTLRSTRRATGSLEAEANPHISSARAARLQRLGIKSNGDVVDDVLAGIEEARNLAKRNKANFDALAVISHPKTEGPFISKPSAFDQPDSVSVAPVTPISLPKRNHQTDERLQQDIDDLYSTRRDQYRFGVQTNGRVHSLLPPNCDDMDSIYSEENERLASGYDVRPPERARSLPMIPQKHHCSRRNHQQHDDHDDVIANLHGTVPEALSIKDEEGSVPESGAGVDPQKEDTTKDSKKNKRKQSRLQRLKSFF
ncbi:uncharacterized protein LOC143469360 [Clavelina lepadiformis]|uniref:uncharacterized protein LOC143469360 n=1 Tax=Clavelina lepadiformis TaxID=159417 RepID=UPI0040436DB6